LRLSRGPCIAMQHIRYSKFRPTQPMHYAAHTPLSAAHLAAPLGACVCGWCAVACVQLYSTRVVDGAGGRGSVPSPVSRNFTQAGESTDSSASEIRYTLRRHRSPDGRAERSGATTPLIQEAAVAAQAMAVAAAVAAAVAEAAAVQRFPRPRERD
jgi:hypothetical protein